LSDAHGQSRHFMHPGAVVSEELDAYAKGRMTRSRLARIQGRVRCEGTPEPLPGELMELNGAGDRFNGQHLISAIRHTLKSGGWTTDIQFGLGDSVLLEEEDNVSAPPAAAMIPPVHGLAIGRVTAIENDPASEYRVQVSVPTLGDQTGPFWARLATLDAGDGRGTFFYPEIDDEVVIGFLSDDPRHPVILGSLHSSSGPAPLEPADANPEKGFVSRESLKALFNDEAKSIQLETPNGNILELSEDTGGIRLEDENGNKIVLDSSGITIESMQDIVLKASGNIQFDASTNLNLAAGAQLKAEGAAGAEFSAGGNVTIKGALVQIN